MHPNIRSSPRRSSVKNVFLNISQNSQKNIYARVSLSFGLSSVISKGFVADFEHKSNCCCSNTWNILASKQILNQSWQ